MGRPGLARHRKFLRLARYLDDAAPGFGTIVARGALETLWDACYESGDSYLGDADDVEALCGWRGRSGVLCKALAEAGGDGHAGFIEEVSPGRYQIHDLWDHAPDYVRKRRAREAERRTTGAALSSLTGQNRHGDRSLTGQRPPNGSHCPPNGETRAPAPAPAPTLTTTGAEPSPAPPSPVVAVLPCVGAGPSDYAVTQAQVDEWAPAYPGIDVLTEVLKAGAWLNANPDRRKTHRGMSKFLVGWLNRSQDKPRGGSGPPSKRAHRDGWEDASRSTTWRDEQGRTLADLQRLQEAAAGGGA